MKSTAIHQKDDWFMINLPGYGNIAKDKIEVDVQLIDKEYIQHDYKELRGEMLMERYLNKQQREIVEEPVESYINAFDQKFDTAHINTIEDVLNAI